MPSDIGLIRRLAARQETSHDLDLVAARFRLFLDTAPDGATLNDAFGLTPTIGGISWWRQEAFQKRDAAIRALAKAFYPNRSRREQAAQIRKAMLAYDTSAWRFDRHETNPPRNYIGTEKEMIFDALSAHGIVPSARQIRRILSF